MPLNGSGTYIPAMGQSWRYDPRLAEEENARQERFNQQALGQQEQLGQIQAKGISDLGDAKAAIPGGLVGGYLNGQKSAQDTQAHQRRMELSEEDLQKARAENQLQNQAVSEEEGAPSYRQHMADLNAQKTQAEIDRLKFEAQPKPEKMEKAQAEWQPSGQLDENGHPILINKMTGQARSIPIAAQGKPQSPPKNPGQDMLDRSFAKDLNEWESRGKPTVDKNLQRLEGAATKLQNFVDTGDDPRGIRGRTYGRFPDETKSQEAVTLRDDVRAAAQGALKATLGAQFTEREGERIMNAAYNESLSPEENLKKIQLAIQELKANAGSMEERANHFRKTGGTLAGYAPGGGPVVTENASPPPAPGTATAAPAPSAGPKAPPVPDGTVRIINQKKMKKVPGGWMPAEGP